MDDIDRDIQKGKIGKREEPLVNPPRNKEVKASKPYTLPHMDVNYHKYKKMRDASYSQPTRAEEAEGSTRSGLGLWFVGFVILFGIVTKILGLW
jgi:hypothetical protein